jgi:hypothetical protein
VSAAKKIILLLWLVILASLGNVSALTPGTTENRVGEKTFETLPTRQAEPQQTAGRHQENGSRSYEVAPDSLLAAEEAPILRAGPLPPGEEPYQLTLFPDEPYNRVQQYGYTPTAEQRASVPAGMEFDHDPTLVQHYYEGPGDGSLPGFNLTQTEREAYGASSGSGSAATPAQQRAQGGAAAQYSKQQKNLWGF